MSAILLDGKKVAMQLKEQMKKVVDEMLIQGQAPPCLAVILLGEDLASQIYVSNKRKACEALGIRSLAYDLPESTTEEELLDLISQLNHAKDIDGILVQLPLPRSIDSNKIIEAIHPGKDVDGFHPYNMGRLAQRNPLLRPCTPFGIIQLLNYYQIPLRGANCLVIGASNIVGRPMASEFLLAASTVTICHRFTRDLERFVRVADIIVVATGVLNVINSDWLNERQVVVDVGMHRLKNGQLRGDVDFSSAQEKVAWITPVPGGVGPMTITTLLQNTLLAAQLHKKKPPCRS